MTKQLFLIRHAEAESNNFEVKDIDRMLTPDGEVVASKVGNTLLGIIGKPDKILASSAVRTRQTAMRIAEQLDYPEDLVEYKEEFYEASTRILLREVNDLDDSHSSVIIVGHNPGIPYFAENITGEIIGGVSPGSVIQITVESSWSEVTSNSVELTKYLTPPNA